MEFHKNKDISGCSNNVTLTCTQQSSLCTSSHLLCPRPVWCLHWLAALPADCAFPSGKGFLLHIRPAGAVQIYSTSPSLSAFTCHYGFKNI